MARVIPLRPPRLLPSDALDWVLLRAFGPPGARTSASPPNRAEALSLSAALGLEAQIAERTPAALLEAELGTEGAAALGQALLAQTAHGLLLRQALARFCDAAAGAGKAVVLLKHAALDALGLAEPSMRAAVDVDVLVRRTDLDELADAAACAGLTRDARWPSELHPLVVVSEGALPVRIECHVSIPGVRVSGGSADATFESLDRAGLLRPAPRAPSSAQVPAEHVVAAHVVAHALAQHRFTPAYRPMRLLWDSALLELDTRPERAERALGCIAHGMDAEEFAALVELVGLLRRGTPVAVIQASAGPARLLAHVVHTSTNGVYADSLVVTRQRQRLREHGLGSWLAHHATTAFMPKTRRAVGTVQGAREPVRSTAEFARGLVATVRLWVGRTKGG